MKRLYIRAGWLLDGTGAPPLENRALKVEDGRIVAVEPSGACPPGWEEQDYSGNWMMPGLMNAHVHIHGHYPYNNLSDPGVYLFDQPERVLHAQKTIRGFLRSGVTYVRNCGSRESFDLKVKRYIQSGLLPNIGMVTAGSYIAMTGGHGYFSAIEADGPVECRKVVRGLVKSGAEMIKLMATGGVLADGEEAGAPQFTYEEMAAIIDEAHRAGRKTAAHAQGIQGTEDVVRAGVDSVEHGCQLDEAIIDRMLAQGTYLVPTLNAVEAMLNNADSGELPAFAIRKSAQMQEVSRESFRRAYQRGVKIALGTDAGTPFNPPEDTWVELKLMIENGMEPMDAILAGTRNCADLFGILDRYGTLEPGKMADLILLGENPLECIDALGSPQAVFKEGVMIR